jgi:uncharacterized protein YukE
MGQAAQLAAASADLHGASSKYVSAAAELEMMIGTMSGVMHEVTTTWKGLGSQGFVTAWQAAARDAFRAIDALGGTGGAMSQLATTIDENLLAISLAESMEQQVPHGTNFGQRLGNDETQSARALSAIASKASSLAGQLQSAVAPLVPLVTSCSTGHEKLPPGYFDGVTLMPQPSGPNGPGKLPPGLVALMDGAGAGGEGVSIWYFLGALGASSAQTVISDGFHPSDSRFWEDFFTNFVVDYAAGPELSAGAGKFMRFTSAMALIQTLQTMHSESKNGNVDPSLLLYSFSYHLTADLSLGHLGETAAQYAGRPLSQIDDTLIEKLVGTPQNLKDTLARIFAQYSLPNDTQVPTPEPGPSPVPPGTIPTPTPAVPTPPAPYPLPPATPNPLP